jgi:hypothetical protein
LLSPPRGQRPGPLDIRQPGVRRPVHGPGPWFPAQNLSDLVASHADPDIIASLDRWLTATEAKLVISRIWERFVADARALPARGAQLPLLRPGEQGAYQAPTAMIDPRGNRSNPLLRVA